MTVPQGEGQHIMSKPMMMFEALKQPLSRLASLILPALERFELPLLARYRTGASATILQSWHSKLPLEIGKFVNQSLGSLRALLPCLLGSLQALLPCLALLSRRNYEHRNCNLIDAMP